MGDCKKYGSVFCGNCSNESSNQNFTVFIIRFSLSVFWKFNEKPWLLSYTIPIIHHHHRQNQNPQMTKVGAAAGPPCPSRRQEKWKGELSLDQRT